MARRRKSLLKKIVVEVAQRKRRCRNSGSDITKGSRCVVVFDDPRVRFCYSREVGLQMIEDARKALTELEEELMERE